MERGEERLEGSNLHQDIDSRCQKAMKYIANENVKPGNCGNTVSKNFRNNNHIKHQYRVLDLMQQMGTWGDTNYDHLAG